MDVLGRYGRWLEAIRELLEEGPTFFPRAAVARLLAETMDVSVVSWNWAECCGSFGCEFDSLSADGHRALMEVPDEVAYHMQYRHPLVQWFRITGDPRPMSVGRVPSSLVPAQDYAPLTACFGPSSMDEHLSIPYRLGGFHHRAFVLARGGEDFSAEDFELAQRVQPLLALLDRQVSVTWQRHARQAAAAGLTGRETAVLVLLSGGGTADAIGRRLGISSRTVHHHLQHIYRKLGVNDRMKAVLAAQAMGLISTAAETQAGQHGLAEAPPSEGSPVELTAATALGRGRRLDWMFLVGRTEEPGEPRRLTIAGSLRPLGQLDAPMPAIR